MKRLATFTLLFALLFASSAVAAEFNCNFPPFNAPIEVLNADGYFIKYAEKEGVSYYNYTGRCVLPIHEKVAPAVAYGFVEGKLYAKIISYTVPADMKQGDFKKFLKAKYKDTPTKPAVKKVEGDWDIYKIKFENKPILIKFKFNRVTKQVKSAWYYEPLRAKRTKVKK